MSPEGPIPAASVQSPFKGKPGLARLVLALRNSVSGFRDAWRHEAAFREEVALASVLVPIACLLPVSGIERAILVASVLLVPIVELLNSSVEAAVDRISLERHSLSKRAKDLGAAAVLAALGQVAVVWALVLLPRFL